MSDHVCKWEIIISKSKPKSAEISFRANKPPGAQLAHYKLGCHKSSIRPRSSVAYMFTTVSKRGFVAHWGLSALWTATAWNKEFSSNRLTSYVKIMLRHFRLFGASAWFTTGIQAVHGRSRHLQFSQPWSHVVRYGSMWYDAVVISKNHVAVSH